MPPSPLRTAYRLTVLSVATATTLTVATLPAFADTASAIGNRYHDRLDSRFSAHRLAQVAKALNYAATAHTGGRTSGEAWQDGLNSSVFGLFGHANAGLFQLRDGAVPAQVPFLAAGTTTDVAPVYSNLRFFTEYLPFVDIDDMRLLVLAGCYTANSSPGYGDLSRTAAERGVDSVVAFSGLVYYPAAASGTAMSATVYSGNYFWDRFAAHAQTGVGVATALARARTDLVTKEGAAGGWDRYVVRGAVASPGAVSLRPAGDGEPLNSQPLGVRPFASLGELTVTSRSQTDGPDGPVTDVRTAEDVAYRLRADGTLLDLTAPPSTTGPVLLDAAAARTVAERFLRDNVTTIDESWSVVESDHVRHGGTDELLLLRYRPRLAQHAGPAEIVVEVDQRTGAITYLSHSRGSAGSAAFSLDRSEAIAAVVDRLGQEATSSARITATADTWDVSRWTVTVDRGLRDGVPDVDQLTLDASTGAVLTHVTA